MTASIHSNEAGTPPFSTNSRLMSVCVRLNVSGGKITHKSISAPESSGKIAAHGENIRQPSGKAARDVHKKPRRAGHLPRASDFFPDGFSP